MATLLGLSIDLTKVDKSKLGNGKYLNITVSINDETNQFGQNVSAYDTQTKEQREAKEPRNYLGNGKVFWTDGNIEKAVTPLPNDLTQSNEDEDLPF